MSRKLLQINNVKPDTKISDPPSSASPEAAAPGSLGAVRSGSVPAPVAAPIGGPEAPSRASEGAGGGRTPR